MLPTDLQPGPSKALQPWHKDRCKAPIHAKTAVPRRVPRSQGQATGGGAPKPVVGGPSGAEGGKTEAVCEEEADCLRPLKADIASRKPFGPGRLCRVSRVCDCTASVLSRPAPVPASHYD